MKDGSPHSLSVRRFDAAEYLRNPEDVVAYLNAALELGEADVLAAALGDVARSRGMSKIAAASGRGRESLYKALARGGNPELATIVRVLRSLNLALRVEPMTGADGGTKPGSNAHTRKRRRAASRRGTKSK